MSMNYYPITGYGLNLHEVELDLKQEEIAKFFLEEKKDTLESSKLISSEDIVENIDIKKLGEDIVEFFGVNDTIYEVFEMNGIVSVTYDGEDNFFLMQSTGMPWEFTNEERNMTQADFDNKFVNEVSKYLLVTDSLTEKDSKKALVAEMDDINSVTFG